MKTQNFLLVMAFFLAINAPSLHAQSKDSMRAELLRMEDADQAIRKKMSEEGMDAAMKDTALLFNMVHMDSMDTKRLKEMLGSDPWFTKEAVGSKGLDAAFILLQHSPDYDFQKRCLPYIEKQAKNGDVSMQDYALLLDRTLMHDNKSQIYGTQIIQVNGEWVAYKIDDEANVNKRRSEIGLFPIEQYMGMINQIYKKSGDKK
jgi:hypothetical protein